MDEEAKLNKLQKDIVMIQEIIDKNPENAEQELGKLLNVSNILYKKKEDVPKDLEEKICTFLFGVK